MILSTQGEAASQLGVSKVILSLAKGGRAGEEVMVEIDEALKNIVRPGIGDWTLDRLEAFLEYIQEGLGLGGGQERGTF